MKKYIVFCVYFLTLYFSFAQRLVRVEQHSSSCLIYKISNKQAHQLQVKKQLIDSTFLTELIDTVTFAQKYQPTQIGHYIRLYSSQKDIYYRYYQKAPFYPKIVNNHHQLTLVVYDSLGREMTDCDVMVNGQKIAYNANLKGYVSKRTSKGLLQITAFGNQTYYYQVNKKRNTYFLQETIEQLFTKNTLEKPKNYGFIAFNKPKYRQGDTVKIKAFAVSKGRTYKKKLSVTLSWREDWWKKKEIQLGEVFPDSLGVYNYELIMNDTLKLDKEYTITLSNKGQKRHWVSIENDFYFEDYQFNEAVYTVRHKKEFSAHDSMTFYIEGKDINGLPLMGVKTTLLVLLQKVYASNENAHIPFELWEKQITLDELGQAEITLPSYKIPNCKIKCQLLAEFVNLNNEVQELNQGFIINELRSNYIFRQKQDSIFITSTTLKKAMLTVYSQQNQVLSTKEINLPYQEKIGAIHYKYQVTYENIQEQYIIETPTITYQHYRTKDSLFFSLQNPYNLMVHYTVFQGKKVWKQGVGNNIQLQEKITTGGDYSMNLQYVALEEKNMTIGFPYQKHQLNIHVNAPKKLLPGQEVNIEVEVEQEKNNKPSKNTLLLTSGVNAKLKNSTIPYVPPTSPEKYVGKKKITHQVSKKEEVQHSQIDIRQYREKLGLDSIPYYQVAFQKQQLFLHYDQNEYPIAQFAPFVKKGKENVDVQAIWLDQNPMYYRKLNGQDEYAFLGKEGYHQLTIRTAKQRIVIDSVYLKEKTKLFVFIKLDGHTSNNIKIEEVKNKLSEEELKSIFSHCIYVKNANKSKIIESHLIEKTSLSIEYYNAWKKEKWVGPFSMNKTITIQPYYWSLNKKPISFFFQQQMAIELNWEKQKIDSINLPNFDKRKYKKLKEHNYSYNRWNDKLTTTIGKKPEMKSTYSGEQTYANASIFVDTKQLKDSVYYWQLENEKGVVGNYQGDVKLFKNLVPKGKYTIHLYTTSKDIYQIDSVEVFSSQLTCVVLDTKKHKRAEKADYSWFRINSSKTDHPTVLLPIFKVEKKEKFTSKTSSFQTGSPKYFGIPKPYNFFVGAGSNYTKFKGDITSTSSTQGYHFLGGINMTYGWKLNVRYQKYNLEGDDFNAEFGTQAYVRNLYFSTAMNAWELRVQKRSLVLNRLLEKAIHSSKVYVIIPYVFAGISRTNYQLQSENINQSKRIYTYPLGGGISLNPHHFLNVRFLRRLTIDMSYAHYMTSSDQLDGLSTTQNDHLLNSANPLSHNGSDRNLDALTNYELVSTNGQNHYKGFGPTDDQTLNQKNDHWGMFLITLKYTFPYRFSQIFRKRRYDDYHYDYDSYQPSEPSKTGGKGAYLKYKYYLQNQKKNVNQQVENIGNEELFDMSLESVSMMEVACVATKISGVSKVTSIKQNSETVEQQVNVPLSATFQPSVVNYGKLRSNFRDYSHLQVGQTNHLGKYTFSYQVPDNITTWNSYILGINNKGQAGLKRFSIPVYQSVMAQLSVPRFMLKGDTLNVIGKSVNYTSKPLQISSTFQANQIEQQQDTVLENSVLEKYAVIASEDSLKVTYLIKEQEKLIDGEEKEIPVFPVGVIENNGQFSVIKNDTSFWVKTTDLPKTMYLSGDLTETIISEMEEIERYPYYCNEQISSKIKVLILQKELLLAQGKEFTKEKKIKKLLKKLFKNQHENGSWGWFNQTNSNYFITAYITQTLQWIAKRGYDVQGITSAKKYLATAFLAVNHKGKRINNSLYNLSVLSELGLGKEYQISDLMEYEPSLYTEILWLKIKQNRQQEISLKPILDQSSQTYFGGRFWGRYESTGWNNSIQLNIWMYHILHNAEGHKKECEEIVNYFLEKRKKSWRNTMESAQILEILLQENDINKEPLEVLVNNQAIEVPYKQLINSADSIQVTKKGRGKIFFTTYETMWNSTPQRVDSILSVYTHFEDQKGSPITTLKAGEMVTLVAEIDLPKAGEYWMFNVPIPSSCTYYGKPNARGSEIHREYFNDRVSVFYESLSTGKYRIEIPLQVRFEGNVRLNPAKMEMMYFPTFYGRNIIKQIQSK